MATQPDTILYGFHHKLKHGTFRIYTLSHPVTPSRSAASCADPIYLTGTSH